LTGDKEFYLYNVRSSAEFSDVAINNKRPCSLSWTAEGLETANCKFSPWDTGYEPTEAHAGDATDAKQQAARLCPKATLIEKGREEG